MKKRIRWEDLMVVGKFYYIKYRYNGKECEDWGTYKQFDFGKLYFKCNNGEWVIVAPFNMISATTS